jgi:hypothetical protein
LAAAINLLMPPHAAADVAVSQLDAEADAEPPASATPASAVLSTPAATDTFSLLTNTCTAS